METIEKNNHKKKSPGFKKMNKQTTRVDLTPMVDLGFLLLTFFVFTTSMASPNSLAVNIPKDTGAPTPVCNLCALTLVPGADNRIWYYEGAADKHPKLFSTTFSSDGIRNLILRKKAEVLAMNDPIKELVLAIKPADEATYKNFVDLMDELAIGYYVHQRAAHLPTDPCGH